MKTNIFWKLACGFTLAALPFVGGCDQEVANSAPATVPATTNQEINTTIASITTAASPEEAEQKLENAPGEVVSTPKSTPANVNLSAPASEIVRLAQAGVDESVMMTYVTNSPNTFSLSADDIIYLNDVGVPGTVVTAMLQRDQTTRAGAPSIATAPVTNPTLPAAPTPYPTTETTSTEPPPETVQPPPQNVSYTYFNDSLSPYGNWIDIAGYGRCWQPTVVVGNPGWQPYCDGGHWVYSDCGWYWASSYSWGWAPFHYGRWFRHGRFGWCWAPDTCWGPSWVSWRSSPGFCGWAPLPPTACFTPGLGFTFCGGSVGFGFSFGLTASHFTFVPTANFCDPHPFHHRLSVHQVNQVFNKTVINNQIIVAGHNRIINRGIPVNQVSAATHREIHPVRIETTDNPARLRAERGNHDRTLTAFRPNMPQPQRGTALVGEGVKPAPQRNSSHRSDGNPTAANNANPDIAAAHNHVPPVNSGPINNSVPGSSAQRPGPANSNDRENRYQRNGEAPPVVRNEAPAPTPGPGRNESRPTDSKQHATATPPAPERTAPLILRGANRPATANNGQETGSPGSNPSWNQNGGGRTRLLTPVPENPGPSAATPPRVEASAPTQNNPPTRNSSRVQNNSGVENNPAFQNQRPFTTPNQQTPAPSSPAPRTRPSSPTPSNPNQADRPNNNGGAFRDAPRQRQPDRQVTLNPTGPVERRQAAPTLQMPRMIQPREEGSFNQSFQRSAPSFTPRTETPVAPRGESRQTPMQSAPSVQQGKSDGSAKEGGHRGQ